MIRRMLGSLVLGFAAVGSLVGCTHPTTGTTASVSQAAILDDPAMQRRDWPQTAALYANGQVIADPTLFNYEPKRGMEKQWYYYFADTGAFLANVFTMPIGLFDPGADADVTYPGRIVPASHYGVPPLHKRPCKCGKPADQCGNGSCDAGACKDDGSCKDGGFEEESQKEKCGGGKCDSCGPTTQPSTDAPNSSESDAPATQPGN
jgi:hypothetical protein